MLTYALLLFLIAAVGGLFLASFVLRGRFAPWLVSLLHMLLGASGLALLAIAVIDSGAATLPLIALCVLVVAALLGLYLASLHLRDTIARKKLVLIHASVAVIGVSTVIAALLLP